MRKYTLAFLALLFCLQTVAQLQSDSTGKKKKKTGDFFYGFFGLNFSTINGESDSYDQLLPGFHGGIGIRLTELNDIMGIRTEVCYSSQGSKYKDTYVSGKVILSYINIPVVLRATGKSGLYGEAGVQPGFLLSAKDKYQGETYDYKDYINGFDFGGILGAGYQKNRFSAGVRVAPGFSNLNKDSEDGKDHNFVVSLRAAISF